jgi:choline-sulfatase
MTEGALPGGKRPNILILLTDEMRYPPPYESAELKQFRQSFLPAQQRLRARGLELHRHYVAAVACSPSRTSLYTGHYPSLHGVNETTGAAKAPHDPDVFWLDPAGVPTLGHYFRAGGYRTFWKGKWHASHADLEVPGTHTAVLSFDPVTGLPDQAKVRQYLEADRLGPYGFSGWVGPEPHGMQPLNSGSSAANAMGRDLKFEQEITELIGALDRSRDEAPWLIMASFVNPHDIVLYGVLANLAGTFDLSVEEYVPARLFDPALFQQTLNDDLAKKPACQASYQASYAQWMQPIKNREHYSRFYYQLHKNVDDRLSGVLDALDRSRFAKDTIVVFTSDHGDLLGSHGDMHQKWYQAYEEVVRVPMVIHNPALFPAPRSLDVLTSHIDVVPTLLGLAGLDAEELRQKIAPDFLDAVPLVGRNLAPLVLGRVEPASVREPLYYMTDDDPSRGLNQLNWTGIAYNSVVQPNHVETVIARREDGRIWKLSRYFDNPRFWSAPPAPGAAPQDVVQLPLDRTPPRDGTYTLPYQVTVKSTPVAEQFEMYDITADPLELRNLAGDPDFAREQAELARLLVQQRQQKRLLPSAAPSR